MKLLNNTSRGEGEEKRISKEQGSEMGRGRNWPDSLLHGNSCTQIDTLIMETGL